MARADDRASRLVFAGVAAYAVLLRLLPYQFRIIYADELEDDFRDASLDAVTEGGTPALLAWWARAAIDLLGALVRQWLRTPWVPVLASAAVIATTIFAAVWIRGKRAFVVSSANRPADSPELILLFALAVLVPVVGTIAIGSVVWLVHHFTGKRRRV